MGLFTGVVDVELSDSQIPLSGPNSVVGRAFVVHELEDDLGKGKCHKLMPWSLSALQPTRIFGSRYCYKKYATWTMTDCSTLWLMGRWPWAQRYHRKCRRPSGLRYSFSYSFHDHCRDKPSSMLHMVISCSSLHSDFSRVMWAGVVGLTPL